MAWIFTPREYEIATYLSQPNSIEIKDLKLEGIWLFNHGSIYLPLKIRKNLATLNDLKRREEDSLSSYVRSIMKLCGKIAHQLFVHIWNCNYYLTLEELNKPEKEEAWYNGEPLVTDELHHMLTRWWEYLQIRNSKQ